MHGEQEFRIVAFGDSITAAGYLPEQERYPAVLQRLLREATGQADLQVLNAGAGGHTITNGAARLQKDVLDRQPHYVLVQFGMNDSVMVAAGRARVPLDDFRRQLTEVCQKICDAGAVPLLATVTPVVPALYYTRHPQEWYEGGVDAVLEQYRQATREVAAEHEWPLVDLARALPLSELRTPENSGVADGVHPTAGPQRVLEVSGSLSGIHTV